MKLTFYSVKRALIDVRFLIEHEILKIQKIVFRHLIIDKI